MTTRRLLRGAGGLGSSTLPEGSVAPEGDVYPCSHARRASYRMGNLLIDPPDRLWASEPGRSGRRRYA
ncbi:MAG: hypothetical protein ICV57_08845, partial [Rubrobacter sp.]|nr:hypothetical protein [Rubrobacter sp.]